MLGTFIKQPAEVVDYDVDFSEYFPSGDSIDATGGVPNDYEVIVSSVSETTPSLVVGFSKVIEDDLVFKQWISGGTNGVTYKVTIRVTSNGGRVKEVEFRIKVKDI